MRKCLQLSFIGIVLLFTACSKDDSRVEVHTKSITVHSSQWEPTASGGYVVDIPISGLTLSVIQNTTFSVSLSQDGVYGTLPLVSQSLYMDYRLESEQLVIFSAPLLGSVSPPANETYFIIKMTGENLPF